MDVGLATCARLPALDSDDQVLHQALLARGVDARPVVWTDHTVVWSSMSLCVIRSTWDYHHSLQASYVQWARDVSLQTTLWNPPEVVAWNTAKHYLRDMEARGISIVPTHWFPQGEGADLGLALRQLGWERAVLKPVISGGSADTVRLTGGNLAEGQALLDRLLPVKAMMLQPYLASVERQGEVSLVFLQGAFSHAVCKQPAAGDFRIQEDFGGTFSPVTPSAEELAFAQGVYQQIPFPTLYGRVDILYDDAGKPCLAELELTEPCLYFKQVPEAADRMAAVIHRQLLSLGKLGSQRLPNPYG